ncbi:MAG: type II/IV secretion system protein [Elusimicrobia bacterium]|nr:type II/IV secretion system protein [Elusimicrobiota bacterium]
MASLPVYWNRCEGDVWGELYAINLNHPHFDNLQGVYMVWLGGNKPAAICAGSGLIREQLAERRAQPELQALRDKSLLVTWAKVDTVACKGVERWLLENLRPKVASRIPDSLPVEVNLPGRPGQAAPDAGEAPNQLFQDLTAPDPAPPSMHAADPIVAGAPPPAPTPAPMKTPAAGAEPQRLPLQAAFVEIVKRAKETTKGGMFGGGGKAKPEEEKLVSDTAQWILKEAVKLRASDVHLEPLESSLRVRFRVDGILEEVLQIPAALNLRVVSHIRVNCGLDPERGIGTSKPEDARMSLTQEGVEVDLRLSTFPTPNGDKAVLRLIPRNSKVPALEEIGLDPKITDALRAVSTRPQGMFIVTGPTGSGKSTTLYTLLQQINSPSRNIVTLEDPIEKKIPGVNQGMIQPKAGFGFAEGLRAILRQDPNVIMVGEIRDLETAEIAVSASLTGHMIFTTLHTNSALGSITRLFDMGLEPFLIASALTAVSAQRLARRVCETCAKPYEPTAAEVAEVEHRVKSAGIRMPDGLLKNLKQGAGCAACRQSGYLGRALLFEYVGISPTLRSLILKKAGLDDLRAAALKDGNDPLIADGLRKAAAGVISISEVFRVVDSTD